MNSPKTLLVVAAVIRQLHDSDQKVLIVRRGPKQSGAGMWEFPGGKVEPGESAEAAIAREIMEELSMQIEVGPLVGEESFHQSERILCLRVYEAYVKTAALKITEHDAFQWVKLSELDVQILLEPDRPFVQKLLQKSLP
jgi:mutator protein MutT